jgi:two-component system, NtrC family, response regulator PilR
MSNASHKSKRVLVIDDEPSIRDLLEMMLKASDYIVDTAESGEAGLKLFTEIRHDLIITDVAMKGMSGIDLMVKAKQLDPYLTVIVMTAHGSTSHAVEAMKLGAADYLTKPFQMEEMKISVERALQEKSVFLENNELKAALGKTFSFGNFVGGSTQMTEVVELIKRVSQTKANILIVGESGTGKEQAAISIHRNSANPAAPFVVVNCGAVPVSLFESEFFGHKKGSFTGAVADRKGYFEQANGGTLFLDEVGEIPLTEQVKLLRAIQQKSFRSVGGTIDTNVDVRIICATNRDLESMVKKGEFREDLFYRLNVIQVRMPPLRERRADVPALADHFAKKFSVAMGKAVSQISREAMSCLLHYNFPGNVRELENIIERAVALETSPVILPESLPAKVAAPIRSADSGADGGAVSSGPVPEAGAINNTSDTFDLEAGVQAFERAHILKALEDAKGVKKNAAKLLGISFRSFRYRIEKYGISDPNPEENE